MSPRAASPARTPEKDHRGESAEHGITVALVGRPNAGKSSLYNAVTGGDAKVGNFPGITVDVLESDAPLLHGGRARFLDLPGVYSLGDEVDPDSDEGQARACLDDLQKRGEPFVIAQVIDATQLALSLRLTKDILARDLPAMLIVTQRDVLERGGGTLDAKLLEDRSRRARDRRQRARRGRAGARARRGRARHDRDG